MKTYTREQLIEAFRLYNIDAINGGWEDKEELRLDNTEECAIEQTDYLLSKVS